MDSRTRNACIATLLVSGLAGLVGAALVEGLPAPCACRAPEPAAVYVLPEVEIVARRLPQQPR